MPDIGIVAIQHPHEPNLYLHGLRSNNSKWSLPGGHAEPGEVPSETARRELEEETGIKVKSTDLVHARTSDFKSDDGEPLTVHLFTTKCPECLDLDSHKDPDKEFVTFKFLDPRHHENMLVPTERNILSHHLESLNKSKNVREQRAKVFGTKSQPAAGSDMREKHIEHIKNFTKKFLGIELHPSGGKINEKTGLRRAKKPKVGIDKPDWRSGHLESQWNPEAMVHELAHMMLLPKGFGLAEGQKLMDQKYGEVQSKYGYMQQKRSQHEVQPMAAEQLIRRFMGLPASTVSIPVGSKDAPPRVSAENPNDVIAIRAPHPTRGGGVKWVDLIRQSRLLHPENRQRMEDIFSGKIVFHPQMGWIDKPTQRSPEPVGKVVSQNAVPQKSTRGLRTLIKAEEHQSFLYHYSRHNEPIDTINPDFHGKGTRGAESSRAPLIPRSYYYDTPTDHEPIVQSGSRYLYKIKHPGKVLDIASPEALPIIERAKNEYGIVDKDELEHHIKGSGYNGYKNSHSQLPNAVALFHPQKVHSIEEVAKSEDDLEKAGNSNNIFPQTEGEFAPNKQIREMASKYMNESNLPARHPTTFHPIDRERSQKLAHAYSQVQHNPHDPQVKASYDALGKETLAQYQMIKQSGLKLSKIKPGQVNPYPNGAKDLIDDAARGHMWFNPTEGNTSLVGDTDSDQDTFAGRSDHPMLQPTNEFHEGKPLLMNDVFRIVHDYFGHVKEGVNFSPRGEDHAWRSHARMYSPLAVKALTTETRGQASGNAFGPHGKISRHAPDKTVFVNQKAGLMPDWAHEDLHKGQEAQSPGQLVSEYDLLDKKQFQPSNEFAYKVHPMGDTGGNRWKETRQGIFGNFDPKRHDLRITAHDPVTGAQVGSADFMHQGHELMPAQATVHPDVQGRKIATNMYTMAENVSGKTLKPAPDQTKDAQGLWKNPNKTFGQAYASRLKRNQMAKAKIDETLPPEKRANARSLRAGRPTKFVQGMMPKPNPKDPVLNYGQPKPKKPNE